MCAQIDRNHMCLLSDWYSYDKVAVQAHNVKCSGRDRDL